MKDRGQEAFDVVTAADLIEGFPAAPNGKSGRLLDGLAFPFPKPIEIEALLGSDIASTCSAGNAAKPTRASTAFETVPSSGAGRFAESKVSATRRARSSGRWKRLVDYHHIVLQFHRESCAWRRDQHQHLAAGLEHVSQVPDALHHISLLPKALRIEKENDSVGRDPLRERKRIARPKRGEFSPRTLASADLPASFRP